MTTLPTDRPTVQKPIRLWPGLLVVTLQWLILFVLPVVVPEATIYALLVGIFGGGLAILLWWLFFSRVPWSERLGALALISVALFATSRLVHASISGWVLLAIFAIPVLCLALVCAAAVGRRLSRGLRRASIAVAILVACGVVTLLRMSGVTGDWEFTLHWRWSPTPEERLLAQTANEPAARLSALKAETTVAQWPGFRGHDRDGVVRGVQISTDWAGSAPVELWRRPIGPGWSSFAVGGDLLYTQEQRGDDELVACYSLTTGQPIWRHRDAARFWETAGGAGPRATPTLDSGRVYTLGATGIVNALNAADGAVLWSRNAAADTGVKVPDWGFAGSPLVVDDIVIVATGGRLVAYNLVTGEPRWLGPAGVSGYSSPHLAKLGGIKQVLLLKGRGVISVAPANGAELWKYLGRGDGIVQPALTEDGNVLIGSGSGLNGVGVCCLVIAHGPGGWSAEERWTSPGLKPHFNDFVVHQRHAFGFDGSLLACIGLADGKRKWKDGRYGHGQVILLPDQNLLLVLSEKGELALVTATPDQFRELARFKAIKGKTWNHPVLVGDTVVVRNDQEMAAFRLNLADR